ncbi:alpha/beta hydrolase [Neorhodopirellula pilleata]|uniref:Acetylxylan esterase n=1 Tax=Neorhodopirellula pilleata TaxID=2714738 RepID=A0A5C6AWU8_9BACT|nr:prolyl oligopeptidase family serine peptidase [Neorhodopirellula pilleata]TWU03512.1 Acetylxylan esterase precursor [Neorhodopirellula pilleata]
MGIDPDKIIAGGASAGGHVAAAVGTNVSFDEETDDLKVSSRPSALVLFNPVFDNGPGEYGHERVSDYWEQISPTHNIDDQTPPTIALFGDQDKHVPVATAKEYNERMEAKEGGRCDLFIYEGQGHGFFNHREDGGSKANKNFDETMNQSINFQRSLGYVKPTNSKPGSSNQR